MIALKIDSKKSSALQSLVATVGVNKGHDRRVWLNHGFGIGRLDKN